ncbi:glycosyltransferase [Candidatus Gillettellia adelgis]
MQGLQAINAKRGIGQYTYYLVRNLLEVNKDHEVFLLLNSMLSKKINYIYSEFSAFLPKKNIVIWSGTGSVSAINKNNNIRREINEKIREACINKISPDILLITSLFEGLLDDAVTSVRCINSKIPTAIILYDLIPLIYKEIYLKNCVIKRWYLEKINHLRRANLLLSISNSSGYEAEKYLGFNKSNVINISADCSQRFKKIQLSENERLIISKRYSLNTSFILYTGGIDHRKNIAGLLKAFSLLPESLRKKHQLVIVCCMENRDRYRLNQLCREYKLDKTDVIFTGYIAKSELIVLYNICMFFIFPSWHEGFGLPILEAMRCGKAVIGGNLSSIPEVIANKEALFDPYNSQSIADKIEKILTDNDFKVSLEKHCALQAQAFSWAFSAKNTWKALEKLHENNLNCRRSLTPLIVNRRRLAFISPLPPAKTGVASYSIELLAELSRHYIIDVIIEKNKKITDLDIIASCNIRDMQFFEKHSERYERVLYHFGNSIFHGYMFKLLHDYPGVVVLHDFFISGVILHIDLVSAELPGMLTQELHKSEGWPAVLMRYSAKDINDVIYKYPCNISVLQNSLGVIAHSDFSRKLASLLYGYINPFDWAIIPLLRTPVYNVSRLHARQKLRINEKRFVVCSFGFLGPTKLNHKLLSAWLHSSLSVNKECLLIFVGENDQGSYGMNLLESIKKSNRGKRITITGWVSLTDYKTWLSAADIAVQLRGFSRGETSGAVLDCMNYGIATIVNANGSFADLDDGSVVKLSDEFLETDLIDALMLLYKDIDYREKLKATAVANIRILHQPRTCAEQYKMAIERFYEHSDCSEKKLINDIFSDIHHDISGEYFNLATAIANNYEPEPRRKQILIDISEFVQRNAKSGIQRVVSAILKQLLHSAPCGWIVEAVYSKESSRTYSYARNFTCQFLNIPSNWTQDSPIEMWQGDVFLGLDWQPSIILSNQKFFCEMYQRGIKVYFIVYDLLPILSSENFFPGAKDTYEKWLSFITQFDGAICISQTVANELTHWIRYHYPQRSGSFDIQRFNLGADFMDSTPSNSDSVYSLNIQGKISERKMFVIVSTIEPRKQHAQVLDAFELLWENGEDVNLVIVGKQGWMVEKFIKRLYNHKELNSRLFWLSTVSDVYLEQIYSTAECLIAASIGEGFGLSLVEAAKYNLPIIVRDIPVFREIAGKHAFYFNGITGVDLANAIKKWLVLRSQSAVPDITGIKWSTWEESAKQLISTLFKNK